MSRSVPLIWLNARRKASSVDHPAGLLHLRVETGGDFLRQRIEWLQIQIMAERFAVKLQVLVFSVLKQCPDFSPIVFQTRADRAELFVRNLQNDRHARQRTDVFARHFDVGLVACIMVHRRPHMLQRRPHLKLEAIFVQFRQRRIAEQRRRNLADVVQRHIAEVINIMHLPLVNRILPVDVEHLLNQRRDLVDFVAVICDDADADQIRHVTDLTVLLALELQLAG